MTEQTKAVFENPELLRQELGKFLDTPQRLKVEIYVAAAEMITAIPLATT